MKNNTAVTAAINRTLSRERSGGYSVGGSQTDWQKLYFMEVKKMLVIIYNRKRLKINLHRFFSALVCLALVVFCIGVTVDFCRYPEKHLTTWKYQLYNEIKAGNTESIDYYNKHYTSKGIYLYGEDKTELLNLATVTGYEATAEGILLHTADGNGYFIEK